MKKQTKKEREKKTYIIKYTHTNITPTFNTEVDWILRTYN